MKKIFVVLLTVVLTSCSGNSKEENEENMKVSNNIKPVVTTSSTAGNQTKVKSTQKIDIQKQADLNKDGIINGNDWRKLSRQQKIDLVSFYTDLTYQSLGITPSKDVKDKEIFRMVPKLNSYYAKSVFGKSLYNPDASQDRRVYETMLATK